VEGIRGGNGSKHRSGQMKGDAWPPARRAGFAYGKQDVKRRCLLLKLTERRGGDAARRPRPQSDAVVVNLDRPDAVVKSDSTQRHSSVISSQVEINHVPPARYTTTASSN